MRKTKRILCLSLPFDFFLFKGLIFNTGFLFVFPVKFCLEVL